MGKSELFEGLVAALGFFAACTVIGYIKENYFEGNTKKSKQQQQQQQQQRGGNSNTVIDRDDDDEDDGDLGDFPFGTRMGFGGEGDGDYADGDEQANMTAIETLVGTADMLVSQGRFEDAEGQYLQALDLVRRTIGDGVPLVGLINHELGTIYRCMGRYAEADTHFGASAVVFGALYRDADAKIGPEKDRTVKNLFDDVSYDAMSTEGSPLLLLLSYCTSYTRALSEQAEVKTLLVRSPAQVIGGGGGGSGSDDVNSDVRAHPISEDEAADILCDARRLAEEAVALYAKCFGRPPEDIKHKKTLAGLLRTLTQVAMFQKQWGDAEAAVRESISLLLESTYPKDPEVITGRMWLSQILIGAGKPEESVGVARELLATHKGGSDEAYFARYLGEIYADCEMNGEAEKSFGDALRLCDDNLSSEAFVESLSQKERRELEESRWETVNCIATLYRALGRTEDADGLVNEMREKMRCDPPPFTTTRFLRTLQCSIRPCSGERGSYVYGINVLIRQRNEKKLPAGSFLVFCFENPETGEMVPMRIEKCVEEGEKTVMMSSPDFTGMKGGKYYKILIKVLASDHKTLMSEHLQLVRCEPLSLSL